MAQIELQRFRIRQAGASGARLERAESAYRRYSSNIKKAFNIAGGRGTTAFLSGRYQTARQSQVSRSVYMGLNNG